MTRYRKKTRTHTEKEEEEERWKESNSGDVKKKLGRLYLTSEKDEEGEKMGVGWCR